MRIGIPRAMLYYKYKVLWETFFEELDCEVVLSKPTNKYILEKGLNYSNDESCLASKIYLGHVYSLIDKCDYIFIPRFCSFKNRDVTCVKFNALYDICNNIFENINILTYNVDYLKGSNEIKGFLKLGKKLGKRKFEILKAYYIAIKKYINSYNNKVNVQDLNLKKSILKNKINILIVSHPYIIYDALLGKSIISYLKNLGINIVYADLVKVQEKKDGWKNYSKTVYWKDSKELLSGLNKYVDNVDGIIFVSVFTCGPDSLVTDICRRKLKNKPVLSLILDELNSDAGMETRLESFTDIIIEKKKVLIYD